MASNVRKVRTQLREFALGLPDATEALPWGERVAKVNKKVFAFLGRDMDAHLGLAVKLPTSKKGALALPFTEPTGYGLGKSGWVSVKLEPGAHVSFEQLRDWVIESYCAVAPKALAARVGGESAASAKPVPKAKAKIKAKTASKPRAKKAAKSAPRVSRSR
jgi:predicted DNA-binding protein (MmcQ/YjbR family)